MIYKTSGAKINFGKDKCLAEGSRSSFKSNILIYTLAEHGTRKFMLVDIRCCLYEAGCSMYV